MLSSSAVDRRSSRREHLADLLLDSGDVGVRVDLAMLHAPDGSANAHTHG